MSLELHIPQPELEDVLIEHWKLTRTSESYCNAHPEYDTDTEHTSLLVRDADLLMERARGAIYRATLSVIQQDSRNDVNVDVSDGVDIEVEEDGTVGGSQVKVNRGRADIGPEAENNLESQAQASKLTVAEPDPPAPAAVSVSIPLAVPVPVPSSRAVICKLAYGSRAVKLLTHEARLYHENLRALQGVCVPECYGYYTGETPEGVTGCLLLQDCGKGLEYRFESLGRWAKEAIVSSLKAIHDAGVQHNHLDEYNVVINERGRPFIIDFEHAEEHACGRKMDIVVNALRPAPSQFGCTELWNVIDDMGLWKPSTMIFNKRSYHANMINLGPEELARHAPKEWSQEKALAEAEAAILAHLRRFYPVRYKKTVEGKTLGLKQKEDQDRDQEKEKEKAAPADSDAQMSPFQAEPGT